MDTKITDHEFDPGDHAYIDTDHLCHDCSKPIPDHAHVPAYVQSETVTKVNLVEADAEWLAWMQRVYEAAFAFVNTPIDDPESGALYRELAETVRRPSRS